VRRAPKFDAAIQIADQSFGATELDSDLVVCQMGQLLV
jgi:hypothetical protein